MRAHTPPPTGRCSCVMSRGCVFASCVFPWELVQKLPASRDIMRANGVWLCLFPSFTQALTCLSSPSTLFCSFSLTVHHSSAPFLTESAVRLCPRLTWSESYFYARQLPAGYILQSCDCFSCCAWVYCMYPPLPLSWFGRLFLIWPPPVSHTGFLRYVFSSPQISLFKLNNIKTMSVLHWKFAF